MTAFEERIWQLHIRMLWKCALSDYVWGLINGIIGGHLFDSSTNKPIHWFWLIISLMNLTAAAHLLSRVLDAGYLIEMGKWAKKQKEIGENFNSMESNVE